VGGVVNEWERERKEKGIKEMHRMDWTEEKR